MTTLEQSNLEQTNLEKPTTPFSMSSWLRWGAVLLTGVLITVAFVLQGWQGQQSAPETPYSFNGLVYDPIEIAPEFMLTDQNNQPVQLSDFEGDVVLLFFGFAHCPDVCPLTLATWKRVQENLGDEGQDVRYLFVTVDPERDTPELIKKHLALFSPDFIGLSGTVEEIEDAARSYHVYMEKVEIDSPLEYLINHTALTFVIDQESQVRLAFPSGATPEEMTDDLQHLLAQNQQPWYRFLW